MTVTLDRLLEFLGNHWIMASGLLIVTILLIQDFIDSAFRKHKVVSPAEAVNLMNNENTVIVDVREPHEYANGHIENAKLIPLGKVEERAGELEAYKQNPVIVTCQSGTRSPQACKKLGGLGFTRVFELKGGMLAWGEQNYPVVKKRNSK
ncbi:rhodanese-like domain-containing protein [Methylocaldum sp. MU1018]